jgi:anti-sigma factor RsiW
MRHDNPQISAYALGELPEEERIAFETMLREEPGRAVDVEETRAFAQWLERELRGHYPAECRLTDEARTALLNRNLSTHDPRQTELLPACVVRPPHSVWWRRWTVASAAAVLLVGSLAALMNHHWKQPIPGSGSNTELAMVGDHNRGEVRVDVSRLAEETPAADTISNRSNPTFAIATPSDATPHQRHAENTELERGLSLGVDRKAIISDLHDRRSAVLSVTPTPSEAAAHFAATEKQMATVDGLESEKARKTETWSDDALVSSKAVPAAKLADTTEQAPSKRLSPSKGPARLQLPWGRFRVPISNNVGSRSVPEPRGDTTARPPAPVAAGLPAAPAAALAAPAVKSAAREASETRKAGMSKKSSGKPTATGSSTEKAPK